MEENRAIERESKSYGDLLNYKPQKFLSSTLGLVSRMFFLQFVAYVYCFYLHISIAFFHYFVLKMQKFKVTGKIKWETFVPCHDAFTDQEKKGKNTRLQDSGRGGATYSTVPLSDSDNQPINWCSSVSVLNFIHFSWLFHTHTQI